MKKNQKFHENWTPPFFFFFNTKAPYQQLNQSFNLQFVYKLYFIICGTALKFSAITHYE